MMWGEGSLTWQRSTRYSSCQRRRTAKALSIALGSLYGVGVGPGDPELLTLKARRIISEAPVVAVPKSQSSEASYALTIVDGFIERDRQEVLELSFPMREGRAQIEHARRGAA